ncbi:unnamed protein product [Linum tenue]|uniref:4-hydroxyphenylpyruvate dioxygenase n=1 Tax=Linum tenue TaxID=586396 RepID=A0AAV0NRD8_9ROSI|nr:unnamed protein product [Linum tenue]
MGKPTVPSSPAAPTFNLVGFSNFVRANPRSDRFKVKRFHHIEFWSTDSTNTSRRAQMENLSHTATASVPTFDHDACRRFSAKHGLAVRAVAMEVEDAEFAFRTSVAHGARPSAEPMALDGRAVIAEDPDCWFLPKFESVDEASAFPLDYGIRRLDHAVGNVPELGPAVAYDVGTSESGLNSAVLANNSEMVLLPMNEPVFGTKRKSQIQTYLEHNEGAGVQHLALMSEDIFKTLREMRKRSNIGGFEVGDVLSDEQIQQCEELGILVDKDDQGTLLQIFTKPVGDR